MPKLLLFPFLAIILILATFKFNLISKISNNCIEKGKSVTVFLKDDSFSPENIEIKRCTQVMFKNVGTKTHWPASDPHPTHYIYPGFDPLMGIDPGESWSFVFDKVGKWRYHNHLSPWIRGTISVTK